MIKLLPVAGTAIGGVISASTAWAGTMTLGKATISFFQRKFDLFKYCFDRANFFNLTIDLFRKYTEEFKKDEYIYLLLE